MGFEFGWKGTRVHLSTLFFTPAIFQKARNRTKELHERDEARGIRSISDVGFAVNT